MEKDVMNLSARCGPTFTRMCSLPIKHTHILLSLQTYWGTWDLCKTSRNCSDLKVVFPYMKQDIPTFSVHALLCLFVLRIMILRWSIRTILRRKNIVDHLENKVKTSRLKSKKCFWGKKLKCGDYRCSFKTNCHGCCTLCKMPFVDKLVKQTDQSPWDTPYRFIARDFNHWKPWISPSQDISFCTNQ